MPDIPDDEHQRRGINHPNARSIGGWLDSHERQALAAAYDRHIESKAQLPGLFDPNLLQVATPRQAGRCRAAESNVRHFRKRMVFKLDYGAGGLSLVFPGAEVASLYGQHH